MRFTLRQMQVFAAIARQGSVAGAADSLGMSQSAASTAVSELERRAGRPLFDRAGKRLSINEVGRMLLPRAIELLDRGEEVSELLAGRGGPGLLRLGTTVTIGNYIAPVIVERYRQAHPQSSVTIDVANMSIIAGRLTSFDIDIGLIEGECAHHDLLLTNWIEDDLIIFCNASHRLAGQTCSVREVLKEPWAVRETGSGTRQTLERAMAPYWSSWHIGMELSHVEAIKSIVAAGSMIGCASRIALRGSIRDRRLFEIRVPDLNLRRRFYIATHRQKYWTPALRAFAEICGSTKGAPPLTPDPP